MTAELIPIIPGLDQEEVMAVLFAVDGNVTKAAKELKVEPQRLRAYVNAIPALKRTMAETMEQGVDRAIEILFEGLRDEMSFQNRFYAAKEFLRSEAGRRRGMGPRENAAAALEVRTSGSAPATITLKWLEPPADS
jgi:hypothetical protein